MPTVFFCKLLFLNVMQYFIRKSGNWVWWFLHGKLSLFEVLLAMQIQISSAYLSLGSLG